jgi:hypothetical protein
VKKIAGEAVRSRSFTLGGVLKRLVYFFNSERSEKGRIFLLSYEGWDMPCDFLNSFLPILDGFCKEVLKVLD